MTDDFRSLLFILSLIFFTPITFVGGVLATQYLVCNANLSSTTWCEK